MEIDIPYSKFQKILQKLRVMIQTIREFHDLGITMMRKIIRYPSEEVTYCFSVRRVNFRIDSLF